MTILVTGGAGFIGSHLVRSLLDDGEHVVVYDSYEPQVHGRRPRPAKAPRLRTVAGDVRDRAALAREVRRADVVVHLAAAVGVGQSQYQIRRYADVNVGGTATLLDILANDRHRVQRVLVAGSMSSYGEGACRCRRCGRVRPGLRRPSDLKRGRWEPVCPACRGPLTSVPTRETDRLLTTSVYGVTKTSQEDLVLTFGLAYGIPAMALRLFNVYGPGQSLSNPYAGAQAIFISRLKHGRPPVFYEDGLQSRDFTSVHDVVRAFRLALGRRFLPGLAVNVGTGTATSVRTLAERLAALCGSPLKPKSSGKFRSGDIRHCIADITAIRESLGYRPEVSLDDGLRELVDWSASASAQDSFERAHRELARRGLI